MQLILLGKLNKQIAEELSISMKTVEVHRRACSRKWASSRRWSWPACWPPVSLTMAGAAAMGTKQPVSVLVVIHTAMVRSC
jgi:hypothetical protein